MHRIDSTTRQADKFGSGKDGFTEGSPGVTPPTETTEDWFDGVQEEIVSPIEGMGITLAKGTRSQLYAAVKKMLAAHAAQNWMQLTNPQDDALNGVVSDGADVFVAIGEVTPTGDTYVIRSTDHGLNWTELSVGYTTAFNSVAYNGSNLFTMVGDVFAATNPIVATSPDGASWTQRTGAAVAVNAYGVAHDQSGLWCSVGQTDGSDALIMTSTDGITWTQRGAGALANLDLYAVAHGNSLWVAVGGAATDPYIVTSPDGTTWTRRESGSFPAVGEALRSVVYDSTLGLWVAVGDNNGTEPFIVTSTDGVSWTQRSMTNPANKSLYAVASDGSGLLVAVGATYVWSADGVTWTPIDGITDTLTAYGLVFGRKNWLLCGEDIGSEALLASSGFRAF